VLTPLLRRTIEDGFGVPVFDMYGCHEINLVAWECPGGGGLHTCDDAAVVEVLCGPRRAGEGERGEVVVTGLHSYAMPFIRYRLGDIAVRGDDACRCGRPLGTIRAIEGRTFEHFQLPDGRVIHPHRIGRLLLDFPAVSRYQITQERPDLVVVRVVPGWGKDLDPAALDRPIRALLGPDVHLQVLTVRDIPPERTGKVQIYRSLASVVRDVSP
jgi:phenylacetate-CoA ligase